MSKWSGVWGGKKSKYSDEFMVRFKELAKTHNASEMSEALGIGKDAVTYLSRRDQIQLSRTSHRARLSIRLDKHVIESLTQEARRRNIGVNTLVQKLLTIIIKDNIYDAVLEDEKSSCKKPSRTL